MPINLPLPPGARVVNVRDQIGRGKPIADINPSAFMSPLQPVSVMAPPGTRIRQRPTIQGENLQWQPKGNETFGYWILREFADTCEMMRAVIDTVEDRICSKPWELRLVAKPGEKRGDLKLRTAKDPRLAKVTQMLKKPDGFWPFKQWLRMLVEDMIVLDAAAIYKERDVKGRIANFRVIDGATINRCITEQGFTPTPPSVAYQQVLYGLVWWDGTTDDLTYIMHNPRTNKRYGYSVIEQCIVHLNIAIRQQDFTQQYFTSGNIPEALCFLPSDLPIDRVKEIQGYIDSILSGNNAKRRRLTFLPGYGKAEANTRPNIIFPKEVLLKDPLMEWLFQLFCYKLGTTPQAMLRMMNRATAAQSAETSEEEGELPKSREVEDVMTDLIQTDLGYEDIEWVFSTKREVDGLKQAQIDDIYVGKVITINEIRDELGKDPRPEAEANQLGEFTPTGFVPLDAAAQAARTTQMVQAKTDGLPEPAPVVAGAPGKQPPKNEPGQAASSKKKVLKRVGATIEPDKLTPASQKAKARIHSQLEKVFQRQKDKAVGEAKRLLKNAKVRKSDPSDEFDPDATAELIYDSIAYEWEHIPSQVRPALEESMRSGIGRGMMQLDFSEDSLISTANTIAENYARDRAAEMVGMAYDDDGKLVPNPDAKWQISETTRDKIRSIVADAFKQETDISKIADAIQAALRGEADDGGIFSPYRAEMIADTEVAQAQVQGNVTVWRESGLVTKVKWLTSEDPNVCEDCMDNDEQVVAFGKPFPDGSLFPPAHPTCRCSVMVAAVSEGE